MHASLQPVVSVRKSNFDAAIRMMRGFGVSLSDAHPLFISGVN
jgi:hypothetical protein